MPGGQLARQNGDFDAVLAQNTSKSPGRLTSHHPSMFDSCLDRLADKPSFYFAPAIQWGDLSYKESLETMQLFADQVMHTS